MFLMLSPKSRFRQTCLEKLALTDAKTKLEAGKVISAVILPIIKSHLTPDKGVALFKNLPDEISTEPLCELLRQHQIKYFFPKTNLNYSMQFCDANDKFPISINNIAILIVPGVAFDRRCNRLGRGRGCYDRFLSQIPRNQILTIGICLDSQLFEEIPVDEHDQCMNMIRTPSFEIIL
jgi:5,10-methenyltetrahydrofolate synthetase